MITQVSSLCHAPSHGNASCAGRFLSAVGAKFLRIALFCGFCSLICGCSIDGPTKMFTFHLGNSRSIASELARSSVTMPVSGFTVVTNNDYFMYSGDLEHVDWSYCKAVDNEKVYGFTFKCNDRGRKRLLQATAGNMGGFIVVKYDGTPIGIRLIDTAITNGELFVVAEIPDTSESEIARLLKEMNESIENINKIAEEARLL